MRLRQSIIPVSTLLLSSLFACEPAVQRPPSSVVSKDGAPTSTGRDAGITAVDAGTPKDTGIGEAKENGPPCDSWQQPAMVEPEVRWWAGDFGLGSTANVDGLGNVITSIWNFVRPTDYYGWDLVAPNGTGSDLTPIFTGASASFGEPSGFYILYDSFAVEADGGVIATTTLLFTRGDAGVATKWVNLGRYMSLQATAAQLHDGSLLVTHKTPNQMDGGQNAVLTLEVAHFDSEGNSLATVAIDGPSEASTFLTLLRTDVDGLGNVLVSWSTDSTSVRAQWFTNEGKASGSVFSLPFSIEWDDEGVPIVGGGIAFHASGIWSGALDDLGQESVGVPAWFEPHGADMFRLVHGNRFYAVRPYNSNPPCCTQHVETIAAGGDQCGFYTFDWNGGLNFARDGTLTQNGGIDTTHNEQAPLRIYWHLFE